MFLKQANVVCCRQTSFSFLVLSVNYMLMSGKQDLFGDTDENNSKGVFQQFDMGIIDVS